MHASVCRGKATRGDSAACHGPRGETAALRAHGEAASCRGKAAYNLVHIKLSNLRSPQSSLCGDNLSPTLTRGHLSSKLLGWLTVTYNSKVNSKKPCGGDPSEFEHSTEYQKSRMMGLPGTRMSDDIFSHYDTVYETRDIAGHTALPYVA